jgi:hypothetical protein
MFSDVFLESSIVKGMTGVMSTQSSSRYDPANHHVADALSVDGEV